MHWGQNLKFYVIGLIAIFIGGFAGNYINSQLGLSSSSFVGFLIVGAAILTVLALGMKYLKAEPEV